MLSRIVIVGAGAMGCFLAARLAAGGLDVTVVDVDQARLDVIGREGITLHDDSGTTTTRVRACLAADVAGPVDLVLLMTKGMFSAAAIRSVAHLAAHNPTVLTLQNGLPAGSGAGRGPPAAAGNSTPEWAAAPCEIYCWASLQ